VPGHRRVKRPSVDVVPHVAAASAWAWPALASSQVAGPAGSVWRTTTHVAAGLAAGCCPIFAAVVAGCLQLYKWPHVKARMLRYLCLSDICTAPMPAAASARGCPFVGSFTHVKLASLSPLIAATLHGIFASFM
jgi:hypothetical protein